jgi:precorrin-4/cobalt-precorrin-4 C11-methyltransferase
MVHFVGAGPGAPDLITLRANNLLRSADTVIYAGSLVNPALLDAVKPGCEIYDSAGMTLEQVIEVMVGSEQKGKVTVRLHTGDPSIYGAIREQMDELDKHGISYEAVPGVSSLNAAAAALKVEYTLPGVSQSVIVTRIEGRTPVPKGEDIASLAAHGASMVIFLSTGLLENLTSALLDGGYPSDCPAAIVYKATWPEEKVIRTTVSKLAEDASNEGIKSTALILVGDFLGNEYERSMLYHPDFSHGFRRGLKGEADEA